MTREKNRARRRFTIVLVPAGEPGWWTATVEGVRGAISQGRGVAQARARVREALSLVLDERVADDRLDVRLELPARARRAIARYRAASDEAKAAQAAASEASREAVRLLVDELGYSTRDAGAALGLSQARVAQLAG